MGVGGGDAVDLLQLAGGEILVFIETPAAGEQTLAAEDFVTADLVYPDRVGEIYQFRHRPEHRWYYFPRLAPDEALLIKCYDSRTDGPARFAP
ncbi:MAG TPA: CmcJ/NvfI family oxidoreductase, partial [Microthrixaceae bacterium]|nr:CmcJ/NvfI family oxidoreductase [Microthrixaceae bacterium]